MVNDAVEEILDRLEALGGVPLDISENLVPFSGRDEITGPVYEIQFAEKWYPVREKLWNSWTGLRRKNGMDHHGPVKPLDTPPESKLMFNGARVCGCSTCQATVDPKLRKN